MTYFTRKGFGRIYIHPENTIKQVKNVIQELDEFEYGYLPEKLIAPFDKYPETVFVGKFCDLDLDMLTAICWEKGIYIWCFDAGHNDQWAMW